MPRPQDVERTYWHGTDTLAKAAGICKEGIKAREISSRKHLAPVKGKVYMTPNARTGLIYAMNGIMMGHKPWRKYDGVDRFGVVFEISGSDLGDIQPDEDSVGEILYTVVKYFKTGELENSGIDMTEEQVNGLGWLHRLAKFHLTPTQFHRLERYDDYAHLSGAGKKLLNFMNDSMKLNLIDLGAHIANEGKRIVPRYGWLVDKTESEKYSKDAGNFFEVAKRMSADGIVSLYREIKNKGIDEWSASTNSINPT